MNQNYKILNSTGQHFIARVVDDMIASAGGDFSHTVLVLPSKRPYAFFRKEFASRFTGPQLLPAFITIHEWMQSACPYRILSKDESVLMFYQYYKEVEKETALPFDKFYSWAPGVLNDFNETDKYLVDPQQLFVNLQHIKDIENWSFNTDQLSAGQEEFKTLWEKLPQYYSGYHGFLNDRGLCTDGFAYRYMAQHIQTYADENKNLNLFFVGLNALSRSEEKSVFTLANANRAFVYLEGHKGFIDHEAHEAGLFLRRYKSMGVKNMIIHEAPEGEKEIVVHECPGTISQVLAAADLIRKIKTEKRTEKIAVVLADESLLIPFLQEMDKGAYNVTMGWPLIHSTWFRYLVALTAWPDQLSVKKGVKRIALEYVKQVMSHPLSASVFNFSKQANDELKNHTSFYVTENELDNWFGNDPLLRSYLIADKNVAGKNLYAFFTELILRHLKKTEGKGNSGMDREVLLFLLKVIENLGSLPGIRELDASNRLMRQLFVSSCRNQPLAFLGEPLEGIQVMGMLESRTLSFDEVIIVSANEGILPGQSFSNSMIPYDLRFGHGLPGIREKEAVFAYYFYRLVQNSKTAHILYASGGEALNRLEKSRYILQLESEGKQLFPAIKISSQTTSIKTAVSEKTFSVIKNTPASIAKIKDWMANGVSASALTKFLSCPKDFYYRYVAGLQEPDSPEEWADDAAFGTLVHDTLYLMYTPLVGKPLDATELKKELANIDSYLEQALERQKKWFDFSTGKNLLTTVAAKSAVTRFVHWEINEVAGLAKQNKQIQLVSLEETTEREMELEIHGEKIPVKFKGRIDRVHQTDGNIFIADYKTGSVQAEKELKLKREDFQQWNKMNGKVLQLLFYEVLCENRTKQFGVNSGLFSLRNAEKGFGLLQTDMSPEEIKEATYQLLTSIFETMLAPDAEFNHMPDARYCEFC